MKLLSKDKHELNELMNLLNNVDNVDNVKYQLKYNVGPIIIV